MPLWLYFLDSFEGIHPVGFPGLPAIDGKRLFPLSGVCGDLRPGEAAENVPAFEVFLRIEFADAVLETADHRGIEYVTRARRPVDAPLPGIDIEEPYGVAIVVSRRAVDDYFVRVPQPVEDLFACGGAIEFLPFRAALEAFLQPFMTHDEIANQKVKIVPSVVFYLHCLLLIKCV